MKCHNLFSLKNTKKQNKKQKKKVFKISAAAVVIGIIRDTAIYKADLSPAAILFSI